LKTSHRMTRRRLLASAGSLLVAAQLPIRAFAEAPAGNKSGIRLQPWPTRIFKTRDAGNERTESWTLWLLVETTSKRDLDVQAATIEVLSASRVVRTTHYNTEGARALTIAPPFPPRLVDGRPSPSPIFWPRAIRVRVTEAAGANVDAMRVALTLSNDAQLVQVEAMLPVESYRQKTALIYPFKGQGIITQAGVTNGGHRNRSGQFATDGVGLNARYGIYDSGDGTKSEHYAGWGRALIAPAAGVVVRARADRPDQPNPESSDPKFFAPEYPNGGDPGNYVVIDHGNSEFSMLAHFQAGSVRVKVGDRVEQRQTLGKLGSSGDTVTPHLHYQLQSGPDHEWADGLPITFGNIKSAPLVRGTYFDAT
jgi:Peptidase family M23